MLTKKPIPQSTLKNPLPSKGTGTPYGQSKQTPAAVTPLPPGRTRITVRYDVGFPNTLYLRGRGANLSWDKGVQLRNVGADVWVWETDAPFSSAEFKVLINDTLYEEGENHTLKFSTNFEYSPQFVR